MAKFCFQLGQGVKMRESSEEGVIVARTEYQHDESGYLVRYKDAHGVQVERWWAESALTPS